MRSGTQREVSRLADGILRGDVWAVREVGKDQDQTGFSHRSTQMNTDFFEPQRRRDTER
jgi:hypothetical protein